MLLSVGFATQAACSSRKNGTHYSHLKQRKKCPFSFQSYRQNTGRVCMFVSRINTHTHTPPSLLLHAQANTYKVIHWPRKRAEIPQQPKSQLWLQTKDATKLCSVLPFKLLFLSSDKKRMYSSIREPQCWGIFLLYYNSTCSAFQIERLYYLKLLDILFTLLHRGGNI